MNVVYDVLCMHLLGAFAKWIETNIGFVMSVRPRRTNWLKLAGQLSLWGYEGFSEHQCRNSQNSQTFYVDLCTIMTM